MLADSSKLGKVALRKVATVDALTAVITDDGADEHELERLEAAGVTVLVAPVETGRVRASSPRVSCTKEGP